MMMDWDGQEKTIQALIEEGRYDRALSLLESIEEPPDLTRSTVGYWIRRRYCTLVMRDWQKANENNIQCERVEQARSPALGIPDTTFGPTLAFNLGHDRQAFELAEVALNLVCKKARLAGSNYGIRHAIHMVLIARYLEDPALGQRALDALIAPMTGKDPLYLPIAEAILGERKLSEIQTDRNRGPEFREFLERHAGILATFRALLPALNDRSRDRFEGMAEALWRDHPSMHRSPELFLIMGMTEHDQAAANKE